MNTSRHMVNAALALFVAGCGPALEQRYESPATPEIGMSALHPTEIEYQLLGPTTGQACAEVRALPPVLPTLAEKERVIGHPVLFERAKYEALTHAGDADALLEIRGFSETRDGRQCVTVVGRAYRISKLRTRAIALEMPQQGQVQADSPAPKVEEESHGLRDLFFKIEKQSAVESTAAAAAVNGWHAGVLVGGGMDFTGSGNLAVNAGLTGRYVNDALEVRLGARIAALRHGSAWSIDPEIGWIPQSPFLGRRLAFSIGPTFGGGDVGGFVGLRTGYHVKFGATRQMELSVVADVPAADREVLIALLELTYLIL